LEDLAEGSSDVTESVGPDESSVDPIQGAFVDRQEDCLEEKKNGNLGETDADAVYD
jgi:hypothetical protein